MPDQTINPQPVGKPVDMSQIYEKLDKLNGQYEQTQQMLRDAIKFMKDTVQPDFAFDEMVFNTTEQEYVSYGYPICYVFVSDSDATGSPKLNVTNDSQTHQYTLTGGWNTLNIPNKWKYSLAAAGNFNVILLRSRIKMF